MLAKKQTQGKELTFTIKPLKLKNGTKYTVIDSEGYTCGFYDTEDFAKRALKGIFNNIKHAKVILNASWRKPYVPFKKRTDNTKYKNKPSRN